MKDCGSLRVRNTLTLPVMEGSSAAYGTWFWFFVFLVAGILWTLPKFVLKLLLSKRLPVCPLESRKWCLSGGQLSIYGWQKYQEGGEAQRQSWEEAWGKSSSPWIPKRSWEFFRNRRQTREHGLKVTVRSFPKGSENTGWSLCNQRSCWKGVGK